MHPEADDQLSANAANATGSGPVTDAKSIEKITFNFEPMDWLTYFQDSLDRVPNKVQTGEWYNGPKYTIDYRGAKVDVYGLLRTGENAVRWMYGPAKAFFNNIPEQGIELNAFYDSLGYESDSTGRRPQGSTGMSDSIYGLPMGSYRYAQVSYETGANTGSSYRVYGILLTPKEGYDINSSDCVWYIYPDSMVDVN